MRFRRGRRAMKRRPGRRFGKRRMSRSRRVAPRRIGTRL